MSRHLRGYLCDLFGREERSDCTITFYCRASADSDADDSETNESERTSKRQRASAGGEAAAGPADDQAAAAEPEPQAQAAAEATVGDPLAAHSLVVCGCSPVFAAQAERWTQQQGPGSRPVLRVALNVPEDLPFALCALKFRYTDGVDARGVKELLNVRRLGGYLQVEGCVEACDEALKNLITAGTGRPSSEAPLAAVADLFSHRALLPDSSEEWALIEELLAECRVQFLQHSDSFSPTEPLVTGGSSWGEVLAWAFVGAPFLLSSPKIVRQMCSLPTAAMEALLGSDAFATDDEASVLLVLATWLRANPTTDNAARKRLCKLIRLSQLSSTYLHVVLPELLWFPISPAEHRFVCSYARTDPDMREQLKEELKEPAGFSLDSAWYTSAPRAAVEANTVGPYHWHINERDLSGALARRAKTSKVVVLHAKLNNGGRVVVANGFAWRPSVIWHRGKKADSAATMALVCQCPPALRVPDTAGLVDAVFIGPLQLGLFKRKADGDMEMIFESFEGMYVRIGCARGFRVELQDPMAADGEGSKQQQLMAQWAPYVHEGKVHGVLSTQ